MARSSAKILYGLSFSGFVAVACSGGGGGSPTSPSTLGMGGSPTTITGTAHASTAPQAVSRICVGGTPACADVTGAGNFTLTGDFAGSVQLQFTTPGGMGTSTIPDVKRGETIVVSLNLNATNNPVQILSRSGGSDGSNGPAADDPADDASEETPDDPADDDSAEDDPADDDSDDGDPADNDPADDDSEDEDPGDNDSEDDDSADDDPADDDSEDDDSADNESEDDDSEDDDSEDDGSADDNNRSGRSGPGGSQRRRG